MGKKRLKVIKDKVDVSERKRDDNRKEKLRLQKQISKLKLQVKE
jgi:hypothetical protein